MVLLKNCVEVNPSTYFNFIDRTRTICTSLPQSLPQYIHDFHLCLPIDHRMHFLRVLFMKHIYCTKSLTHYYSKKGSNFTCCCHNPFYLMVEWWYNVYLANNIHFFFTTKRQNSKEVWNMFKLHSTDVISAFVGIINYIRAPLPWIPTRLLPWQKRDADAKKDCVVFVTTYYVTIHKSIFSVLHFGFENLNTSISTSSSTSGTLKIIELPK